MKLLGELEHGESFTLERDWTISGTVDRSLEPPHGGFVYATINGESKYFSKQTHVMTTNQPSPLQNALQAAILGNGLARPMTQQERIWHCVKDMQPVKYTAIAKRTGISGGNVSSLLGAMEKRGMVYSRGAKGNGPTGVAREYMTELDEYKLLPPPSKKKKATITLRKPAPTVSIFDTQPIQTPLPANALPTLDTLTIAQARELWGILNKMFGG